MRNRKVVIGVETLNTQEIQVIDPKMEITEIDSFGDTKITQNAYPIDIQIVNDTGAPLEFNAILSEQEYNAYELDDTQFDFQRVPVNTIVQSNHTNFSKTYRFLIRCTGVAVNDLTIEFINYR